MSTIKQNILVTGGAGYVGAVLVPALLEEGHSVTVIDLMMYGEDVLPAHKNLRAIKGDIRDVELVKKSLFGINTVMHLACISNDPSFELNPDLGKSINLDPFDTISFHMFQNPVCQGCQYYIIMYSYNASTIIFIL